MLGRQRSLQLTLFVCQMGLLMASNTVVMDKSPANKCGQTISLTKDVPFTLKSLGKAPTDSCNVSFKAENNDECTRICVKLLQSTSFTDCGIQFTMKGVTWGEQTEMDCTTDLSSFKEYKWCITGQGLDIKVQEYSNYTRNQSDPGYVISAEVTEICSTTYRIKGMMTKEEFEYIEWFNLVTGLAVGFGLASMFLVLLVVTYCYTKHNPDVKPRESDTEKPAARPQQKQRPYASEVPKEGRFHYKTSQPEVLQRQEKQPQESAVYNVKF